MPNTAQVPRGEHPPLSFGQHRLWFLSKLFPDSTGYNVPVAYRIQGRLGATALERALARVVDRHEILRTRYEPGDGTPYQMVGPTGRFQLRHADLSTEAEPAARAVEMAARERDTAFDLAHGPVLRALLMRLGPSDHVLAVVVHHIAFDGESLQIFASELTSTYAACRVGTLADLPALRWQYADFAAWQRSECTPEALDAQFTYWRRCLAGAPEALAFPYDCPRPALPSQWAGCVSFSVRGAVAAALDRLAKEHGVTMFAITMAAFCVILSRYSGADDVVVGCGINGRPRARSAGLIGFFTNSVPIRARMAADRPFIEFARRIADTVLDAIENQDLPFDQLVEWLRPKRDLSRNPIMQTWFDCAHTASGGDQEVPRLAGAQVTPFPAGGVRTRFDLEAHLSQAGPTDLGGRIIYATDLFEQATAERLAGHFVNVLEAVAADPGQRLTRIEMLGADERHELIEEWGTATSAMS